MLRDGPDHDCLQRSNAGVRQLGGSRTVSKALHCLCISGWPEAGVGLHLCAGGGGEDMG